jgi:ubiquinone/menaquinone biosynthesis C-methylase UbiE
MKEYKKVQTEMTDVNMSKHEEMWCHVKRFTEYIEWIESYIDKDMRVLDIGCRDGAFLSILREKTKAWKLYGIEISEMASVLASDKGIKVYNIDAHDMSSLESNYFDVICMAHFLEHTHNPRKILDDVIRILKPRGVVFIEVPLEPKPDKVPTKWGHYHTFQRPQDLNNLLMGVGRGSGYEISVIKQLRDNKKNKWYRVVIRKMI